MPRARVTEQDPSLPHQVKLRFKSTSDTRTLVLCNCKKEPLGEIPNNGEWRPIYNKAELHDNTKAPFNPREHYTANAKVYHVD